MKLKTEHACQMSSVIINSESVSLEKRDKMLSRLEKLEPRAFSVKKVALLCKKKTERDHLSQDTLYIIDFQI